MSTKSNVVSISSRSTTLSTVPDAKPARTVNGKPLTAAQNAARDLRNKQLVEKRAAKKAMLVKLPVFGQVLPSDGTFVPEASQEPIEPIGVLGTLVSEAVLSEDLEEQCTTEQLRDYAAPTTIADVFATADAQGFSTAANAQLATPEVIQTATDAVEVAEISTAVPKAPKSSPTRKTDRRWAKNERQSNLNGLFRGFRRAGLAAKGFDLAALGRDAVCLVKGTVNEKPNFTLQCTPSATERVTAVLTSHGYAFNFDDATGTFNVAH